MAHRRRLHWGDGGDSTRGQKVVETPPTAPHEICYISFWNSTMSRLLHVGVWVNPSVIKLNKLANILGTLVAFSNFSWSILHCLYFTYFPNSIFIHLFLLQLYTAEMYSKICECVIMQVIKGTLISAWKCIKHVWRPGFFQTHWGRLQRSPKPGSWISGVGVRTREGEKTGWKEDRGGKG